jgi:hypothetical protein
MSPRHPGAGVAKVPTESASHLSSLALATEEARQRSTPFHWELSAVPTKIALSCEVTVVSKAYVEFV